MVSRHHRRLPCARPGARWRTQSCTRLSTRSCAFIHCLGGARPLPRHRPDTALTPSVRRPRAVLAPPRRRPDVAPTPLRRRPDDAPTLTPRHPGADPMVPQCCAGGAPARTPPTLPPRHPCAPSRRAPAVFSWPLAEPPVTTTNSEGVAAISWPLAEPPATTARLEGIPALLWPLAEPPVTAAWPLAEPPVASTLLDFVVIVE